jgi:hypothetical protein
MSFRGLLEDTHEAFKPNTPQFYSIMPIFGTSLIGQKYRSNTMQAHRPIKTYYIAHPEPPIIAMC